MFDLVYCVQGGDESAENNKPLIIQKIKELIGANPIRLITMENLVLDTDGGGDIIRMQTGTINEGVDMIRVQKDTINEGDQNDVSNEGI